ncbi:MAG: DUF58 domain-containing protein [Candidatus Woesearchaeota archaeon]
MQQMKEVIAQIKKIELKTKHLVDGLIAGNYHSIFKGQGIEFSEIRDYRPGDDIRAIDWKVTARFNHPFIKEFIEERDLRVFFAFDFSASGNFGNLIEKRKKAIELTATLMFSALRNNDNVGLFIFTNSVEKYIPERKGRRHILKIISKLITHKPQSKETNLKKSLTYIANIIKKRSILFVISDFYSDDFTQPLTALKNKHDVIAIKIADTRETELPDIGLIQLEDEETDEQILIDTSDKEFRENYSKIIKTQNNKLNTLFKKHKIDTVEITTNQAYEIPLRKFFKTRQKKVIA